MLSHVSTTSVQTIYPNAQLYQYGDQGLYGPRSKRLWALNARLEEGAHLMAILARSCWPAAQMPWVHRRHESFCFLESRGYIRNDYHSFYFRVENMNTGYTENILLSPTEYEDIGGDQRNRLQVLILWQFVLFDRTHATHLHAELAILRPSPDSAHSTCAGEP